MTMMQKVQAKKSKKGFTLVELVIVIAILAILAAIAIPVITTTINSSKMSVMESDCATVNMLVKEAINNQQAGITTTTYAGVAATSKSALTVSHVLTENNLPSGTDFFTRSIGGSTYKMVANTTNGLTISVQTSGNALTAGQNIASLASAAGL